MKIYEYDRKENNDFRMFPAKKILAPKNSVPQNIFELNLTFRSPHITGIEKNDNVSGHLFINKDLIDKTNDFKLTGLSDSNEKVLEYYDNPEATKKLFNNLRHKARLLVFVHGFSTNENKLINYYRFIEKITDNNTICLFINLPFHLDRTPGNESSGKRLVFYDDKDTLYFFHQCVVDIRKALDIAEELICPAETDICGISLGAMVSVIVKALEKRIRKAVLLLGGGYWEDIHWKGILRFILRGNCADSGTISRNKCHEYYSNYFDFLENFKKDENKTFFTDLSETLLSENNPVYRLCTKKCYLCDPLTFGHMINPESVIMINSNIDHFFTRKSSNLLWKELGKPQIYWLNYPHFSSILNIEKVYKIISGFLYSGRSQVC